VGAHQVLRRRIAIRNRAWCRAAIWLHRPLLLGALFWLLLGLSLADGLWLTPEMIHWVKDRYGDEAEQRVLSWQLLMIRHQGSGEGEKLAAVNDFFNALSYQSDWHIWGKEDYWATPIEALGKGSADCEDYSIAKYFTLREMGVADEKMRIMYVKALELDEAHMVLTYYDKPGSVPLVLDNLNGSILSAGQRADLAPVYSFNAEGLWLAKSRGLGQKVGSSERLSLWQNLKTKMENELER
jgi:predicted transglutaminase-like cysteine proteinase